MALTIQMTIPDDLANAVREATEEIAPESTMNQRARYLLAKAMGIDSTRAFALLLGELPRRTPREIRPNAREQIPA
jgi:hypothetical protein